MSLFGKPSYCVCPKLGQNVSLEQSEGQCRELHNCSGDPCPLESELGQLRFACVLQSLASNVQEDLFGGRK